MNLGELQLLPLKLILLERNEGGSVIGFPDWIHFCFSCRENNPGWDIEIQDDVIEECNKHGGVVHIYVDKNSAQVRIWFMWSFKCPTVNKYIKRRFSLVLG